MGLLKAIRLGAVLAVMLALSACATPKPDPQNLAATDIYEPQNRKIHKFNVALDRHVLRPLAKGYDVVTPTLFKHLIGNGLDYLALPADFINFLLQGEIHPALETLGRFTINTVLGIGVLDPATEFGLPRRETDFGVTLARYGAGEGVYLVLPFLGPATVRHGVGQLVDVAFRPTLYLGLTGFPYSNQLGFGLFGIKLVHERDANAEVIDQLLYESADSYVTLRSVYLQHRRALVAGEQGVAESLPDIFESEPLDSLYPPDGAPGGAASGTPTPSQ